MKFLLISLFAIFTISCATKSQQKCVISIFNDSAKQIGSIRISIYSVDSTFSNFLPGTRRETVLIIKNKVNYEGAFNVQVYIRDSIKLQTTFGYFANTGEIKPRYHIRIKNDFTLSEF